MSVSYTFVYGNFIKVKKQSLKVLKKINCCYNEKCESFEKESESKFCENCGRKIISKDVLAKEEIEDAQNVIDFLREKYNHSSKILNDLDYVNSVEYIEDILVVEGAHNYVGEYFEFNKLKKVKTNKLFNKICDLLDKNKIEYKAIYGGFMSCG